MKRKVFITGCALAAAAGCLATAFLFASPAAADPNGGVEIDGSLKEWDTDKLSRYIASTASRVGGKNYRIPFHDYRGYVDRMPAKPCIQYIAGGSRLARSRSRRHKTDFRVKEIRHVRSLRDQGFFRPKLLSAAGNWSLLPYRCAGCAMVIFRIFTGPRKRHII